MHNFTIFCDDLQEGIWFQNLHSNFSSSSLSIIPSKQSEINQHALGNTLKYDRPDIILQDNGNTIFVLERTIEVPSGHNVGQRYGRLLAAAESRIPVVYFGPYAAYKHGGNTAGPRYMNLRLFYSLLKVSEKFNTAITTINWPVDTKYEVLKNPNKDLRIIEYLNLFFAYYDNNGFTGLTEFIKNSDFQKQQIIEQNRFIEKEVRSPEKYDTPPNSVQILPLATFKQTYGVTATFPSSIDKIVLYHVGMTYIRSDPYTGMAALYRHLYTDKSSSTLLILNFAEITSELWYQQRPESKTYRMFKEFADAILFQDCFIWQSDL